MDERTQILWGLIAFVAGTWAVIVLVRWFLHSTITLGIKNAQNDEKPTVKNTKVLDVCQNCLRTIGKLEQAYVYKDNIVCEECNTRLNKPK